MEVSGLHAEGELLQRLKSGDKTAFESIYTKYWSRLYLYAYNILREKHASQDIVQEVLVSLWIKRSGLNIDNLNAFLYTSTRYQVLNAIRAGKVHEYVYAKMEHLSAINEVETIIRDKELNNMIDMHISVLPEKCREIFTLSRRSHLSNKEIAQRLGITSKTVENQITIALRKLRSSIGSDLIWLFILASICPALT